MIIRNAGPADNAAIRDVVSAAFGQPYEADLIERLRADDHEAASIVAEADGRIVGHVCLSWLKAEFNGSPIEALALAPLAVHPGHQRRGIGKQLARAAIERGKHLHAKIVLVLGDPQFYRPFGFDSKKGAMLLNPFEIEAFMALELAPNVLENGCGSVDYPAAFGLEDLKKSPQSGQHPS
ncbi:MAG: GNAT family N-acetyltransferase [Rhodomicrobiaceae bacterium]